MPNPLLITKYTLAHFICTLTGPDNGPLHLACHLIYIAVTRCFPDKFNPKYTLLVVHFDQINEKLVKKLLKSKVNLPIKWPDEKA
jgi:hypothetical protein